MVLKMFEPDLSLFWFISKAPGSAHGGSTIGLCKVGLVLVGIVYILDFLIGRSKQEDAEVKEEQEEKPEVKVEQTPKVKGATLGW